MPKRSKKLRKAQAASRGGTHKKQGKKEMERKAAPVRRGGVPHANERETEDEHDMIQDEDERFEEFQLRLDPAMTERFRNFLKDTKDLTARESLDEYRKWIARNTDIKDRMEEFFRNDRIRAKYGNLLNRQGGRGGARLTNSSIVLKILAVCIFALIVEAFYKSSF